MRSSCIVEIETVELVIRDNVETAGNDARPCSTRGRQRIAVRSGRDAREYLQRLLRTLADDALICLERHWTNVPGAAGVDKDHVARFGIDNVTTD